MKKKSLIVGAGSPFMGPAVHLEAGEWLVEPPSGGVAKLMIENGVGTRTREDFPLRVHGPCRVWGVVVEGTAVYLDAQQVTNGG